jgi:3-oxoacyl-[acyl-carrier protein] reductase
VASRVALVTGGSRGIGRAVALALAADGADVAVNYHRDEAAAAETVGAIEALGRRSRAYRATVGVADETRAMVAEVVADFGFVDILVNSAGIASRGLTVADTDPAELERVVRTHALGPHHLCAAVLPSMRSRLRGDIVMISSVATVHMAPNSAPYNMGKAAVEALAFTLAKEERDHGIRVNVVAPGLVDTDMGRRLVRAVAGVDEIHELDASSPFGRVCTPDDVANVVRFLVSDEAFYLTGQKIVVDGGGAIQAILGSGRREKLFGVLPLRAAKRRRKQRLWPLAAVRRAPHLDAPTTRAPEVPCRETIRIRSLYVETFWLLTLGPIRVPIGPQGWRTDEGGDLRQGQPGQGLHVGEPSPPAGGLPKGAAWLARRP